VRLFLGHGNMVVVLAVENGTFFTEQRLAKYRWMDCILISIVDNHYSSCVANIFSGGL
jgi:hypothetical protein